MWSSNFPSRYLPKEDKNASLKRYMHFSVHCSIMYNSQDLEATLVLMDRWMDKKDVVYIYTMEYYSAIKIMLFCLLWQDGCI